MKSVDFDIKVIGVGNIRVGGTGKTAVVDYLFSQFPDAGMVSRGYGRKTKGFINVETTEEAIRVGDEPLMIKMKYPLHPVVVCENRALGITHLVQLYPEMGRIVLDDNFQHRWVEVDTQLLLTEWDRPFFKDRILPAGRLREPQNSLKRADVILVTKCPQNISLQEKQRFERNIPLDSNRVFFSHLRYKNPVFLSNGSIEFDEILVITGIDNPAPFIEHLEKHYKINEHISYKDHYHYTALDVKSWIEKTKQLNCAIFTTEKDAVKIMEFQNLFDGLSVGVVSIELAIDREPEFLRLVNHG